MAAQLKVTGELCFDPTPLLPTPSLPLLTTSPLYSTLMTLSCMSCTIIICSDFPSLCSTSSESQYEGRGGVREGRESSGHSMTLCALKCSLTGLKTLFLLDSFGYWAAQAVRARVSCKETVCKQSEAMGLSRVYMNPLITSSFLDTTFSLVGEIITDWCSAQSGLIIILLII